MMNMQGIDIRSGKIRLLCGLALATLIVGCSSTPTSAPVARPAQVRSLDTRGFTDPIDIDRIALARFVGAWDFRGWYDPPGESRRETAGLAACTIERGHFLMLDTARVIAQAGDAELAAGSMLFSSEPGIGLMLTSWSTQSPAVRRFSGRVEAEGSRFIFDEVRPVTGNDRLRMVMRFENDNRWVAEFYRESAGADVIAASYTFIRAG